MKIKSIIIENYRSIKDQIILNVEPISGKQTFMLLGINESGKSNILEAIALLDEDREFDYSRDCHSKNEDDKKDISISYELDIAPAVDFYREQFSKEKIP